MKNTYFKLRPKKINLILFDPIRIFRIELFGTINILRIPSHLHNESVHQSV